MWGFVTAQGLPKGGYAKRSAERPGPCLDGVILRHGRRCDTQLKRPRLFNLTAYLHIVCLATDGAFHDVANADCGADPAHGLDRQPRSQSKGQEEEGQVEKTSEYGSYCTGSGRDRTLTYAM